MKNALLSEDELSQLVDSALDKYIERQAEQNSKQEEQLLTSKAACAVFVPAITQATLINWTNQGLIPVYRIGSKPFYKRSEIINAAKSIKKYKQKF